MLKKKENTNELIPHLIESFNNFNKTVYNRIKFDGIVNFFHSNADKKFNNYVKLSEKRFKSVKSGSRISNIIQQQKKNYENVENKIINNYLFTNFDEVESEIEKLEKNNNFYKTKDINEIRQKIKDSLLNFTFKEIEYRKKLDKKIKQKKEKNNNKIVNEEINNSIDYENENKLILNDENEDFLQTKEIYNEIIKKDQNNFNEKIKNYNNNFIDKIKEITNENKTNSNENKSIKIDKKRNQKIFSFRYNFYPKSFQFINYRDDIKPKFIKKKHVDVDFDIIKIKKFNKKIHLSNNKNNFFSNNNNLQSYFDNNNKPNSNLLKNTIKVVKTEVENSKFLEDKIALKKENFDDFFNKFYPEETIENFENKIKNTLYSNYYLTQKKNENNNKNLINNNNNNINIKNSNEKKTYSNKLKDIGGKFKEIYSQFKIKWKEDEEQLEKEKQIEKLKQKEIFEFLRNSKIIDRNNQLFIDGYSMRESKTNENIKEFNKSLPKYINFNKKKLNIELNNFFKQKEKIENNEKIKEIENYEKFQEDKFNDWYEKQKPWEEFKNRIKNSKENEILIKIGEKDPLKQTNKIEIKFDKEKEYNDFLNIKKLYSSFNKQTNE